MVLPLNLAMTPSEIAAASSLPERISWMSCHFSVSTMGIMNIPEALPDGAMLILNDRENCAGHSADLVAQQLLDTVQRFRCESVLLDFQRPRNEESAAMVKTIADALPCPVAVTEVFADDVEGPVFLAPCPLHKTLSAYLQPWENREIWMEAALCQQNITVSPSGSVYSSLYPAQQLTDGFYSGQLHCRYHTAISGDSITFTLFDTMDTLKEKLSLAQQLGVTRAVGLYQEFEDWV